MNDAHEDRIDASSSLEITATALEVISLSHIPLPFSAPPLTSPSSTSTISLSSLSINAPPATIRLPAARTRTAAYVQTLLRQLAQSLHQALVPPFDNLTQVLRALLPVIQSSTAHAHHFAHLNVVSLLLTAISDSPHDAYCFHAVNALRPLLQDTLARSRFAVSDGPSRLLRALHVSAMQNSAESSATLTSLCATLADVVPNIPSNCTHVLRTSSAFDTFRRILTTSPVFNSQPLASHLLRLLPPIIVADPRIAQPLVREYGLLAAALKVMRAMSSLSCQALHFVYTAIMDDLDNIALFGTLQASSGLQMVLHTCRSTEPSQQFLTLLPNLLTTLAQLPRNFHKLCLLGLSITLIDLLPRLPALAQPSAIRLLSRAVTATPIVQLESSTGPLLTSDPSLPEHATAALSAVLNALTLHEKDLQIQASGLRLLADVFNHCVSVSQSLPPTLYTRAVHIAYSAMSDFSDDARVMESCARLLLSVSPSHIQAGGYALPTLVDKVHASLTSHCSDDLASEALADLDQALEYVVGMIQSQVSANAVNIRNGQRPPKCYFHSGAYDSSASGSLRLSFARRSSKTQPRPSISNANLKNPLRIWGARRVYSDFTCHPSTKAPSRSTGAACYSSADSNALGGTGTSPRPSGPFSRIRARLSRVDSTAHVGDGWRIWSKRDNSPARTFQWPTVHCLRNIPELSAVMTESLASALEKSRDLLSDHSTSLMSQVSTPSFAHRLSAINEPFSVGSGTTASSGSIPKRWEDSSRKTVSPTLPLVFSESDFAALSLPNTERRDYIISEPVFDETPDISPTSELSGEELVIKSPKIQEFCPLQSFNGVVRQYGLREAEDEVWDHDSFNSVSPPGSGSPQQNGAWVGNVENIAASDASSNSQVNVMPENCMSDSKVTVPLSGAEAEDYYVEDDMVNNGGEESESDSSGSVLISSSDEDEFDLSFSPRSRSDNIIALRSSNWLAAPNRPLGERERGRAPERLLSGSWNRPHWSIWPAFGTSDHVGEEASSFPNVGFHPRVESGSLQVRQ